MISADVMEIAAAVPASGITLLLAACVCAVAFGMHLQEFHVLNSMASNTWNSINHEYAMGVFLFSASTVIGIRVASNFSTVDCGLCADKDEMESKMRLARFLSRTKKTMKMEAQQLHHVVTSLQDASLASESHTPGH